VALLLLAVPLLFGHKLVAQVSEVGQESSPGAQPAGNSDETTGYEEQTYGYESTPTTRPPLDASQLEQLVAPIALYPDALLAQVLAASTYPTQVEQADRWRQEQAYASPEQIASGADVQPWDASVKALTAFPQVLAQMDRNLQWTTDLGNAYYNQPEDVLEAVQVMRGRAQAAGNLRSTPQQVVQNDGSNIVVAPADPQVVYVPAYNPWAVYGAPMAAYPGFSLLGAVAGFFASSAIRFGLGIAMSAFTHTPWGWLAWGLDWLAHSLMFHGAGYYSHNGTVAHWGFPQHRFYAYSGREGLGRANEFARVRSDGGRRGRTDSGGWHQFGDGSERRAGNWGEHGFRSLRSQPEGMASDGFRSYGAVPANRGEQGFVSNRAAPVNRGATFKGSEAFHGAFHGRAYNRSGEFRGSPSFAGASGKSHGRGRFGGGRSPRGFVGSSNFRGGVFHGGGGHAPKFHGGGGSRGGHSPGGGHGGGHSHGHHH
jgi:Protein of unknown function (DUF3300)